MRDETVATGDRHEMPEGGPSAFATIPAKAGRATGDRFRRSPSGPALEFLHVVSQSPRKAVPSVEVAPTRLVDRIFEGLVWQVLRVVGDLSSIAVGLLIVAGGPARLGRLPAAVWVVPPATVALLLMLGAYRPRLGTPVLDGIVPRLTAVGMASSIALAVSKLLGTASVPAARFADVWLGASAALVLGGVIVGLFHRVARFRWLSGRSALIIGTGDVGRLLAARLERYRGHGLRPIGILDDGDPDPVMTAYGPLPILGAIEDLVAVAKLTAARHVILAFTGTADRDIAPVLREARDAGLAVSVVPRQFESVNARVDYENVVGVPMLRLTSAYSGGACVAAKAFLDRLLAAICVIVGAPALALLALAVKLSSPGPVLFRQQRIGLDGAEFEMLKFRSMRLCPDEAVAIPAAGQRLAAMPGVAPGGVEGVDRRTRVGRLLRRTSLDELPQLFNVVRGEMSLVGPRPERPEFARRFGDQLPRYRDRHRVKSGITGWAQVHGLRGRTSLSDRIDWDNYYIEHWSLWLDLKILLLTPLAVLRKAE